MIQYRISQKGANDLLNSEIEILNRCVEISRPYFPIFARNGYELKVEIQWSNRLKKTWSNEQLPIENGYECWAYCFVEKDKQEVCIESSDGEDDYYLMSSWMISSVSRVLFHLKASIFTSLDGLEDEIKGFLIELTKTNVD